MKASTVIHVINSQLGFSMDAWIPLYNEVKLIVTGQDAVMYIDQNARYFFNTTDELLEVVYGTVDSEDNFTSHAGETSNFETKTYVSFSELKGIVTSVFFGPYGTHYRRPFTNTF